jgi:hypothetical protein
VPIPEDEQVAWLQRLDDDPIRTAAEVAAVVQADLDGLQPGQKLHVSTQILDDTAGRAYVSSLLTSVDHVEVSALAKRYIQLAKID